jgi:hypothetical protein
MFVYQHNETNLCPRGSDIVYTAPDRTQQINKLINEVSSIASQLSNASTAQSTDINESSHEIVFRNTNINMININNSTAHEEVKTPALGCNNCINVQSPPVARTAIIYAQNGQNGASDNETSFKFNSKI